MIGEKQEGEDSLLAELPEQVPGGLVESLLLHLERLGAGLGDELNNFHRKITPEKVRSRRPTHGNETRDELGFDCAWTMCAYRSPVCVKEVFAFIGGPEETEHQMNQFE